MADADLRQPAVNRWQEAQQKEIASKKAFPVNGLLYG
jgi:hypothetical protein